MQGFLDLCLRVERNGWPLFFAAFEDAAQVLIEDSIFASLYLSSKELLGHLILIGQQTNISQLLNLMGLNSNNRMHQSQSHPSRLFIPFLLLFKSLDQPHPDLSDIKIRRQSNTILFFSQCILFGLLKTLFGLLDITFRRHLKDLVVLGLVGLKSHYFGHLEEEIWENQHFLFLIMTQLFWDYQEFMRQSSLQGYRVLVPSKFLGYLLVERRTCETSPIKSRLLNHLGIRLWNSPVEQSYVSIGQSRVFLAEAGEFFLDESDDGSEPFVLFRSQGFVYHFIGIVPSVEIDKALQCCKFLVLELGFYFFSLPQICNFLEEASQDIGCRQFVAFDGVVYYFNVAIVFFLVSGCEDQFVFVSEDPLQFRFLHQGIFYLIFEVVDVRIEVDGFNDFLFAVKGVDWLSGGVGYSFHHVLQGSSCRATILSSHYRPINILNLIFIR